MVFGIHILSKNLIIFLSVLISWLKSIGIRDKKRDKYDQEIEIYVYLISKGV